ncbi:polynucleotide adenylyltransferase [Sarracenia purpurea var. burkii]
MDSTLEARSFLYEALSPLSAAAAAPSSSSTRQPPLSQLARLPPVDSEPYVVFRNEISLSTIRSHSPKTAAPDYFSLDIGADAEETTVDLLSTPSPAAPVTEPEWTLETGWFRANSRFKSPMLQLHKGIGNQGSRLIGSRQTGTSRRQNEYSKLPD